MANYEVIDKHEEDIDFLVLKTEEVYRKYFNTKYPDMSEEDMRLIMSFIGYEFCEKFMERRLYADTRAKRSSDKDSGDKGPEGHSEQTVIGAGEETGTAPGPV